MTIRPAPSGGKRIPTAGLDDAVVAHADRSGATHNPNIATMSLPTETFSPSRIAAEEAHQVLADQGVVIRRDIAEEVDHIVVGVAGQVNVSEEDDDVATDLALDVHAAKEADGVVNRGIAGHVDVGAELDCIVAGIGWGGGGRKSGAEQAEGKKSLHA